MPPPYRVLAVAAVAATTVALFPLVSQAAETPAPAPGATTPAFDLSSGMLAAIRRDLGLTDDQIAERLRPKRPRR